VTSLALIEMNLLRWPYCGV